jgi:hypothetical protein
MPTDKPQQVVGPVLTGPGARRYQGEHDMSDVVFPEGTDLAPPFTVPASDWAALDQRVATTIAAQNIAPEIEEYIPNYPDLLQACMTWHSTTWSGLITQAVNTELFGTKAAEVLGQLSDDLSGVEPGDPVPGSVSFIIRVQFQALAQVAGDQAGTAQSLVGQIATFVSANRAADASLQKIPLDGWFPIAGPIGSLEATTTDLQAGWGAVVSQLQAASGERLEITTAALLASNLDTAITSWKTLAQSAATFVSMVATLRSDPAA